MTTPKVNQLLNDVEELLAELSDEQSPEVARLRQRVGAALSSTRDSAVRGGEVSTRLAGVANSLDAYIVGFPRLAFASGIIVAGAIGYLFGSATRRSS